MMRVFRRLHTAIARPSSTQTPPLRAVGRQGLPVSRPSNFSPALLTRVRKSRARLTTRFHPKPLDSLNSTFATKRDIYPNHWL